MLDDVANSQQRTPRLIGISALVLGTLVLAMLALAGGAGASGHDLVLTKSDSPDPVVAGNNLTYTISVRNNGTAEATDVVVTDTLPADVDFVSASTTLGSCVQAAKVVTCNLGAIGAGGTATVTIVVKAKKAGSISNTAAVTSSGVPPEVNTANNTDTATTVVQGKGTAKGKKKGKVSCATPTITGTGGDDVINGTSRADVIVTFAGNDQVFALGGKDLVCTGSGFDAVFGGDGGDTAIGGANADRLVGQAGGDLLKGKGGRDKLRGKAGNDTLNGGKKRDSCKGGAGRDTLIKCP